MKWTDKPPELPLPAPKPEKPPVGRLKLVDGTASDTWCVEPEGKPWVVVASFCDHGAAVWFVDNYNKFVEGGFK